METIVVTGGEGFIGSNLIKRLNADYQKVKIISLDNNFSGQRNKVVPKNNNKIIYLAGDTKDVETILKDEKRISTIFHFGEFSRIVKSFEFPEACFSSNHTGTLNVIKYCSKNDIKLISWLDLKKAIL